MHRRGIPSVASATRALVVVAITVLLTGSLPAGATTYIMMSDEDLADSSPVVVRARVLDAQPSPTGRPYTDYRLQVERVAKGRVAADARIVISVLGGGTPSLPQLAVWGVPRFEVGEDTLLFLAPGTAGTPGAWQVNHFALGAFRVHELGGVSMALRSLGEIDEVDKPGGGERVVSVQRAHHPRDLDRFMTWVKARNAGVDLRFMTWVKARNAGVDLPQDYFLDPADGTMRNAHDGYALLLAPSGTRIRWPNFDFAAGARVVRWFIARTQAGFPGGGRIDFNQSIKKWDKLKKVAIIEYRAPAKRRNAFTSGFTAFDGNNTILMNDPNGEIANLVGCTGTLAIGGPWFIDAIEPEAASGEFQAASVGNSHRKRGKIFRNTVSADIISNNGLKCFYNASPNKRKHARQLYMHELGHTLGLGHSLVTVALMFPSISPIPKDVIKPDDSKGIRINGGMRYTEAGVAYKAL